MSQDTYTSTQKNGSSYVYTFDLKERCRQMKTTVASAVWTKSGSSIDTPSADDVTNTTSFAMLAAIATGVTTVTSTVTFASGEVAVLDVDITVV